MAALKQQLLSPDMESKKSSLKRLVEFTGDIERGVPHTTLDSSLVDFEIQLEYSKSVKKTGRPWSNVIKKFDRMILERLSR